MQRNNSAQQATASNTFLGKRAATSDYASPSKAQKQNPKDVKSNTLSTENGQKEPEVFLQIRGKFYYVPKHGEAYAVFYFINSPFNNLQAYIARETKASSNKMPKVFNTETIWPQLFLAVNERVYHYFAAKYHWPAENLSDLPRLTDLLVERLCVHAKVPREDISEIKSILEHTYGEPRSFIGIQGKFKFTCDKGIFAIFHCDTKNINSIQAGILNKFPSTHDRTVSRLGCDLLILSCYNQLAEKYKWNPPSVEELPEFPKKENIADAVSKRLNNQQRSTQQFLIMPPYELNFSSTFFSPPQSSSSSPPYSPTTLFLAALDEEAAYSNTDEGSKSTSLTSRFGK